jgi:diguanylate cyclase (GGDEF)-like protein
MPRLLAPLGAARHVRSLRLAAATVLTVIAIAFPVRALMLSVEFSDTWDARVQATAFVAGVVLAWTGCALRGWRRHDVLMAVGLTSYAAGWLFWFAFLQRAEHQPFPSLSDALWLAMFPCVVLALGLEAETVRFRWAFWLDVLIGSVGAAAAVSAFVVPPATRQADWDAIAINAAYLGGDTVLLLLAVSIMTVRRFRVPVYWWVRLGGVVVFVLTDFAFLGVFADTGAYPRGPLFYALWLAAFGTLAWSVGRRGVLSEADSTDGPILVVPLAGASVAVLVLVHAGPDEQGLRWLAAVAVLLAVGRMGLAFQQVRALAGSRRLAMTDELTGLSNRRGFHLGIRDALHSGRPVTVLLIDLDGFKEVNDTLGHAAGDALLALVGRRFAATARRGADRPHDVVARLGGDEFAVLLPGITANEALDAAERVVRAVSTVYRVDGIDVRVSASGGVVQAAGTARASGAAGAGVSGAGGSGAGGSGSVDDEVVGVDELLRRADVAMYAAKAGRLGVMLYRRDLDTRTREGLQRLESLRSSLDEGRLVVHYQPKVDLRTGVLHGVEALARIDDPVDGLLLPDRFLGPLAQAGAMPTLTALVLDAAVAQVRRWQDQGHALSVAVNIPADACVDGSLVELVRGVLDRHDVPGGLLTLEVTEEVLLHDHVVGRTVLGALRDLGVRISIDDYGTGYSSLAYLLDLPLDELKLDRAFIRAMGTDPRAAAIVASTAALAHSLDLRVVAEGVETEAEWAAVKAASCDDAQGYLRGRPMPASEVERLVAAGPVVEVPVAPVRLTPPA